MNISYTIIGDYLLPDLKLEDKENCKVVCPPLVLETILGTIGSTSNGAPVKLNGLK